MALSNRMLRKLHDAGFVNITGLQPFRQLPRHETIRLGEGPGVMFWAYLHLQDELNEVVVSVDLLYTEDREILVAPFHTSSLVKIRPLMRKVYKYHSDTPVHVAIKAREFLVVNAPHMGWHLDRS